MCRHRCFFEIRCGQRKPRERSWYLLPHSTINNLLSHLMHAPWRTLPRRRWPRQQRPWKSKKRRKRSASSTHKRLATLPLPWAPSRSVRALANFFFGLQSLFCSDDKYEFSISNHFHSFLIIPLLSQALKKFAKRCCPWTEKSWSFRTLRPF